MPLGSLLLSDFFFFGDWDRGGVQLTVGNEKSAAINLSSVFSNMLLPCKKPEMLKLEHDHELQPRRRWASMSWPSFDLGTKFQSEWCKTFEEKPASNSQMHANLWFAHLLCKTYCLQFYCLQFAPDNFEVCILFLCFGKADGKGVGG